MYEFLATEDFTKNLARLDITIQKNIKEKLVYFSQIENPIFFARKLRGYKDIFRFRISDYRVIFKVVKKTILLLLVQHRKNIYAGL